MLSLSHLIIIIIAALIFLGPDKIPQFLKSCGEGIVLFKKTISMNENNKEEKKINRTKTISRNENNKEKKKINRKKTLKNNLYVANKKKK